MPPRRDSFNGLILSSLPLNKTSVSLLSLIAARPLVRLLLPGASNLSERVGFTLGIPVTPTSAMLGLVKALLALVLALARTGLDTLIYDSDLRKNKNNFDYLWGIYLREINKKAKFVKITKAGFYESMVHSVEMTQKTINYKL